ncbi:DmpA family aminopeptidase [Evansella halocellulosilytica]|uniref:DmpA family aminopeptidase n=1 Tax=Evansella halocellulosilytica TaxID=2011013 RepID=UPI000BB860F0|nr:P1 family peptidase [Evansella halocellulosilytica]
MNRNDHTRIKVGTLPSGEKNCITDVQGVKVGHRTLDYSIDEEQQKYACTGVTAILPHSGNLFREKVPAASYVINGFGKTTGLIQLNELGLLESPIMLTNTFSVPAVSQGTLQYMLDHNKDIGDSTSTINLVTGECNDSYLNSIRELQVKPEHAIEAIKQATSERAAEGAIGAGKGMVCFGYKGGIGTASRLINNKGVKDEYVIGALVLTNFGKKEEFIYQLIKDHHDVKDVSDGSIMIIIATDAPVNDRQLLRIAKRSTVGLGRTGSQLSHGSGDIVIAFSTANKISHHTGLHLEQHTFVREDAGVMNSFFTAAADITEEAILNSLLQANSTKGRNDRYVKAFPFPND